jgi:hypothetical protein
MAKDAITTALAALIETLGVDPKALRAPLERIIASEEKQGGKTLSTAAQVATAGPGTYRITGAQGLYLR